jgi:nicotinamide phosphoribosyltransferase
MTTNIILDTDSYKASHWKQYPPNTTSMFSYIESRGGKFDATVFFGLQYYVNKYLTTRVTTEMVEEAKQFYAAHGEPFNYDGWMRIATVLGGKLPVRIRAVPEGTVVKTSNILVSIESTDPETFWVASWLETMLVRLWYPINVATLSYYTRKVFERFFDETSDDVTTGRAMFKLHDFGSRGVSSQESAAIGGAAHLINFLGSDTVVGIYTANKFYDIPMAAFSIPAAEHSTMTSWGKARESAAYENMITQYGGPGKLFAVVSDSYDIYNAVKNIWGDELKQKVIDMGGTLVVRPDSGHPPTVVVNILNILGDRFGFTTNSKGYKVLPPCIRVIQGDGVNYDSIFEILETMQQAGWSIDNVAFGMGGALLQGHNRDTQKFAMKCSSVTVDGVEVDVYKDPVTDDVKRSKRGRLDLVKVTINGSHGSIDILRTVKLAPDQLAHPDTVMQTVYENGEVLVRQKFDDVRKNAWG